MRVRFYASTSENESALASISLLDVNPILGPDVSLNGFTLFDNSADRKRAKRHGLLNIMSPSFNAIGGVPVTMAKTDSETGEVVGSVREPKASGTRRMSEVLGVVLGIWQDEIRHGRNPIGKTYQLEMADAVVVRHANIVEPAAPALSDSELEALTAPTVD